MKNLKWIREQKRYLLKNDETTMVDLSISPTNGSSFSINNKLYQISRKGFWNPAYVIHTNEEEILKLSHGFWGSNGNIVFNDGTVYSSEYKNKGGLKLRFIDGENEILTYGTIIENKKRVFTFSIGISMVDAEKLLLLAALGMVLFTNIFREDTNDDDIATSSLLATLVAIS